MRHFDRAAPYVKRRTNKAIDLKQVKTDCGANYIDDRVERPDFMEMDAFDRLIVDSCFGFSEPGKDLRGSFLHSVV